MEIAIVSLTYLLLTLIPINGALYLAARSERRRNRRILMGMWKLTKGKRR